MTRHSNAVSKWDTQRADLSLMRGAVAGKEKLPGGKGWRESVRIADQAGAE
ncbi:hypothetical protein [Novosphingobium naphthalenivorans]|uniref:hypothetical protein n=1 Tax=Novosphingobium naphthalenivorans TaxID=273168 RepID=UPI000AFB8724|nr:hypothetical protein [Novosphingobium naphthalenivorans]